MGVTALTQKPLRKKESNQDSLSNNEPVTVQKMAAASNLTKSQLQIWTGQKLNPQMPLYNMPLPLLSKVLFNQQFSKKHFKISLTLLTPYAPYLWKRTVSPLGRSLRNMPIRLNTSIFRVKIMLN